jgi:hypothetical protein
MPGASEQEASLAVAQFQAAVPDVTLEPRHSRLAFDRCMTNCMTTRTDVVARLTSVSKTGEAAIALRQLQGNSFQ